MRFEELTQHRSVSRWANRLNDKWSKGPICALGRWCDWLKARGEVCDPDELVRMQAETLGQDRFRFLDLLQEWVQGLDVRVWTKKGYYNYIRGFFLNNRAEFPKDPSFRFTSRLGKIVGTLTVDDIRLVVSRCNSCYRAVFLGMLSGGMGLGELLYWSDEGLRFTLEQLDSNRIPIRVDLPGRKQGRGIRPFYTFLGRDAVKALRDYLEEKPHRNGSIFFNQFGRPITRNGVFYYWRRQLLALGLVKKYEKYGKNLHEIRDVFRSRWEKSGSKGIAAEFFMGHIIDPNDYNKAFMDVDYARSQYLIAEPWLNILSQEPDKVPRTEMESTIKAMEEAQNAAQKEILARLEYLERRLPEK